MNLLYDVWHTFRSDRVRFLLTLSGVVIGVASLIMLSSLLQGAKEALASAEQQATEENLVKVRTAEVPERDRLRTTRALERRDERALGETNLLGGAPVATEQELRTEATFHKARRWVRIIGTTPAARELYGLSLERGRFLSELDGQTGARVAVVGQRVYTDLLGAPKDLGGVDIVTGGARFTVVGVMRHKATLGSGEGGWAWDGRILVPEATFTMLYRPTGLVDRLFVRLSLTPEIREQLDRARQTVRGTLLRRHYGVKNFRVGGEDEEDSKEQLIMGIISTLLLATAALSLTIGGINIMNIMLVAVTERTREIGLRRALGASRRAILSHFLAESAVVALLGGLVGVALGLCVTRGIVALLGLLLGGWNFHIVPWAIPLGVGAASATGVLFGLYPATRAAKLAPAEALRFE